MIVHKYWGRFGNQVIQYLLIKYYSILHDVPVNFINGNCPTHPYVLEYTNLPLPIVEKDSENKLKLPFEQVYRLHDVIDYGSKSENILFQRYYGMNPKNFKVVNDQIAKQIISLSVPKIFDEGDVICAIRGGDIIENNHKIYNIVPADFYLGNIKKYNFERVYILGELDSEITMNIARDIKKDCNRPVEIIRMKTMVEDFVKYLSCPNLIGGYSSFHFVSAYLSEKNKVIFPKGYLNDLLYYHKYIYEDVDLKNDNTFLGKDNVIDNTSLVLSK